MTVSIPPTRSARGPWRWKQAASWQQVALVLLPAAAAAGLWLAGRSDHARAGGEIEGVLRAVAESKARAVAAWRKQRLADAALFQSDPLQIESIIRLTRGDETARRQLTLHFARICEEGAYQRISVFDGKGAHLFSVPATPAEHHGPQSRGIRTVLAQRRPVESDLSRHSDGKLRMNLWVPVITPAGQTVAVILLAAAAEQTLIPELQTWPGRSASATTLLLRPEGDNVAILNRTARRSNALRDLLLPIRTSLPAARAARGEEGYLEGVDERGHRILAFSKRVPETPWSVLTQIDRDEVFSVAAALRQWMAPTILSVLALLALGHFVAQMWGGFPWQKIEAEKRALDQKYQALVEQLPVVVYMASPDQVGKVLYVSRQIVEATGFEPEEWLADPGLWMRQVHPDDRESVVAAASRIRESRDHLSIFYRLIRKDGSVWWCRDRMVAVRDAAGNPEFISGIFFDATELQEARQRLEMMEAVVVNSRDGILIARPCVEEPLKSTIVYVNDALLRQTGYRREECLGQRIALLYGEESDSVTGERLRRAVTAKGTAMFECINYRKGGVPYWTEISLFPLVNQSNEGTLVVGIRRDITRRRQMEAAMRSSETLLRGIADSVPALIWKLDLNGNCTFLNRQFRVFTGIPIEAALGYGWLEAVHPDDVGRVLSADSRETGEFELEYRLRRADGHYRWMFARAKTQCRDGNIESLVVSSIDVTDRKQMEEELRRSQIRMHSAERAGGVGFWERDLRTDFAKWSEGCFRLYGLEPSPSAPDTALWMSIIHPEDRALVAEDCKAARSTANPFRPQFRVIWPDGSVHWLASYASILRDAAGVPEAMIGAVIDVTAVRDTEEELEGMNRELQRLAGELLRSQDAERRRLARELHDGVGQNLVGLKLIVAGVQGADEHQRREIAAALELLDETSREIRTLSYLLHPPLLEELGLTSALRSYAEGFSRRTGIRVECEFPPDLGRLERDHELALFRIVQEALGNIHRHSGGTEARVALTSRDGLIELSVVDHGRGIPFEMLSLERGGVGLASMRRRAAQLGGDMEVRTGPGGTTIAVRLPAREAICA